jgi:hypothetical protein
MSGSSAASGADASIGQAVAALYATLGKPTERVINGVRELTFHPSDGSCVLVRIFAPPSTDTGVAK